MILEGHAIKITTSNIESFKHLYTIDRYNDILYKFSYTNTNIDHYYCYINVNDGTLDWAAEWWVLDILTNLGGKGSNRFFGNGGLYYYIDDNNLIQHDEDKYSGYTYYESLKDYLNPKNQIINYLDI